MKRAFLLFFGIWPFVVNSVFVVHRYKWIILFLNLGMQAECDQVVDCWILSLLPIQSLSCSLSNQAFAPGFVLLLIMEEEEEEKTGVDVQLRERERDLPHHLAWRHTGPWPRDWLFTVAASVVCLLALVTGIACLLLKAKTYDCRLRIFLIT